MCSASMIIDHYHDKWRQPQYLPVPYPWPYPYPVPDSMKPLPLKPSITEEEITDFRKLLERAREYDKANGQPDCELDEKRDKLKKLAKELGVEIAFV